MAAQRGGHGRTRSEIAAIAAGAGNLELEAMAVETWILHSRPKSTILRQRTRGKSTIEKAVVG